MSLPDIRGFRGETPLATARVDDTTDDSSFYLGLVAPGGEVSNYECWWYNYGTAYLYDAQLRIVAHPTLDQGSDSDTIEKMSIGASPAEILSPNTMATKDNTSGWTYPIPYPWKPFEEKFAGGIKWEPPEHATPGLIRKAFQWDGAYHPGGWDFIIYPMSNLYLPDSVHLDHPMEYVVNGAVHGQKIKADGDYPTGFCWEHWKSISGTHWEYYQFPNSAGNPWFDNVDNPTGYVISTLWHPADINGGGNCGIQIEDGQYKYAIHSKIDGGTRYIGIGGIYHTGSDEWHAIADGLREVDIIVQGSALQIVIDGSPAISVTLNDSSSERWFRWGALPASYSPTPGGWGHAKLGFFKMFFGGTSKPIT